MQLYWESVSVLSCMTCVYSKLYLELVVGFKKKKKDINAMSDQNRALRDTKRNMHNIKGYRK